MNRISIARLRLALRYRCAVKASPLGGWLTYPPASLYGAPRP